MKNPTMKNWDADRTEIVDECEGCERIHACGKHCKACLYPHLKWKNHKCNLATHLIVEVEEKKTRVGQQKGKKKK